MQNFHCKNIGERNFIFQRAQKNELLWRFIDLGYHWLVETSQSIMYRYHKPSCPILVNTSDNSCSCWDDVAQL